MAVTILLGLLSCLLVGFTMYRMGGTGYVADFDGVLVIVTLFTMTLFVAFALSDTDEHRRRIHAREYEEAMALYNADRGIGVKE